MEYNGFYLSCNFGEGLRFVIDELAHLKKANLVELYLSPRARVIVIVQNNDHFEIVITKRSQCLKVIVFGVVTDDMQRECCIELRSVATTSVFCHSDAHIQILE